MSLVTLALLCVAVAALWAYSKWRHSYWASRGVPTPPYVPILGHMHQALSREGKWKYDSVAYHKYGGSKFCGLYEFFTPVLLVGDPDLLKHILVKDFDHFVDRMTLALPHEKDKMTAQMLSLKKGDEWKQLRAIMSPTFSSGKMKGMFPLVCEKADAFVTFSLNDSRGKPYVDMKYNFGRFTIDTIASCAFGIECNSLVDEDAEFPKKADKFFEATPFDILKFLFMNTLPSLAKLLNLRFTHPEADFLEEVVRHTIKERMKGERRGDFLDLLLEARNSDGAAKEVKETGVDSTTKSKYRKNPIPPPASSLSFPPPPYELYTFVPLPVFDLPDYLVPSHATLRRSLCLPSQRTSAQLTAAPPGPSSYPLSPLITTHSILHLPISTVPTPSSFPLLCIIIRSPLTD
ncbi:cytochrome P450 CYP6BQ22 [Penaeus vannamei]|uniref:Cytochrome P450 CYP6BQ22 n=1 Tax=Penaeus vannamei TaxID=6689 RepID=A0A423T7I1_PENVA|nr:cytochrome P450 CYP6BQ22 [Penaeus vannamei]